MIIERDKGHGRYATVSVDIPRLSRGWHIKLRPGSESSSLEDEARRTKWARKHLPSPKKAYTFRMPGVAMLITKTLEGSPSYKYIDILDPPTIIAGLSVALRTMRNVNTDNFPFSPPIWTTEQAVKSNVKKLAESKTKHKELHPDFASRTLIELSDIVNASTNDKEKVLSHGDLCMPNVLLDDGGKMTGIVDLGGLHIGNKHLDLAVMSWTVEASMGEKWSDYLLDQHGTTAEDQNIIYNRLAYDLGLNRPNPWQWIQSPELAEQRARLSS